MRGKEIIIDYQILCNFSTKSLITKLSLLNPPSQTFIDKEQTFSPIISDYY